MVEEGQESLIDTLVNKVSYAHVEIFFFLVMFLFVLFDFYFPIDDNFLSQENDKLRMIF